MGAGVRESATSVLLWRLCGLECTAMCPPLCKEFELVSVRNHPKCILLQKPDRFFFFAQMNYVLQVTFADGEVYTWHKVRLSAFRAASHMHCIALHMLLQDRDDPHH